MIQQTTPTGAYINIKWLDDDSIVEGYYVHFGDIPENGEDDHVFYYCDDEIDLKNLMNPKNCRDFVILGYELI